MRRRFRLAFRLTAGTAIVLGIVSLLTEFNGERSHTFDQVCGWATIASVVTALPLFFATIRENTPKRLLAVNSKPAIVDARFDAALKHEADTQHSLMLALTGTNHLVNVGFVKLTSPFRDHAGPASGNIASIAEYFGSLSPARMVVLGRTGSGKTVLALSLQAQ